MKFNVEIIKTLHGYNVDGSTVVLQEGDEVYLKLDLASMNLYDKEAWLQKYPDGWVKGTIHSVSNSGKKIMFVMFNSPCTNLALKQSDILEVSDKIPN